MASKKGNSRPSGKNDNGTQNKNQPVTETQEQKVTQTQDGVVEGQGDVQGQQGIADAPVSVAGGEQAGADADSELNEIHNEQGNVIGYGDDESKAAILGSVATAEDEDNTPDDVKVNVAGAEQRSVDDSNPHERDDVDAVRQVQGQGYKSAEPAGQIIREGDDLKISGTEAGDYVIVTEDIWKEFYPANSKRPSYSLLYGAGTAISKHDLDRLA